MKTGILDTALITIHHGGRNELRREATLRAVASWDAQATLPEQAVFLEMLLPGEEPCFHQADLPKWLRYIRIFGRERNRSIFQKEAMWNLGAKFTDRRRLLFIDSDCDPMENRAWLQSLYDLCSPGVLVHAGLHLIHEGQPQEQTDYYSYLAPDDKVPKGARRFPGLGYCISREDFDARDGFNPFAITGGGDAVFLFESARKCVPRYKFAKRYFNGTARQGLPQLEPAVPECVIRHNFHGDKNDRAYRWSREVIELFGVPRAFCHIDRAGLVAWNDPKFWLADIAMQKTRMHTMKELLELVAESAKTRLLQQDKNRLDTENDNYNPEDFHEN